MVPENRRSFRIRFHSIDAMGHESWLKHVIIAQEREILTG
jgi:hypothetical protein